MRQTDIAIVGGGLAGSTAAAMLGRAGISAVLIDPHKVYPPDFRCEKLDSHQVGILRKTGLVEPVLRAATLDNNVWVARLGRLLDKRRPSDQNGIFYDTLVNTVRNEISPSVEFIEAKVTGIKTSTERQTLTLSNGEEIVARLVVLANGLNIGLRHSLGIEREITSPCHSITVGFNLAPCRPREIRISGADLLHGKLRSADVISDVVSDRLGDARKPDGLSHHGRSVAAPHAPDAGRCAA